MLRHFLLQTSFKRGLSSEAVKATGASPTIDGKSKIVYGGDLPVPTPSKSVGKILFERLLANEKQNSVLQVEQASGIEVTTNEYLKRAVAVAEKLKELGIEKGDFVTLVGKNSLNMNLTLTGTLFLGAVAVPISHKSEMNEFKTLLEAVKPKIVACDTNYLRPFTRILKQVYDKEEIKIFLLNDNKHSVQINAESFKEFIGGHGSKVEDFKPAEVENPKEELALVMKALTDGSLGRAIGITHHNINSIIARFESKNTQELKSDVLLMVQRVMWLSGIYSLLQCCCFGSKLVIMEEYDNEEFLKAIERFKEIGINVEPAYGMNELTGVVLESNGIEKDGCKYASKLVPQVYGKVVSEITSHNVGPNEKGEICFRGPITTLGYINNPKATTMLFDKTGYLQSGSYGFYDENGNFFILDTIYYVIKYKEYRISPKELENIIKNMTAVKDVAVSGIRHPKDGYCPIAFVMLEKGQKLTEEAIVNYVKERVPEWKTLRGGVVFLRKIPRYKDNGIIKRALFRQILSKYQIKTLLEAEEKKGIFED